MSKKIKLLVILGIYAMLINASNNLNLRSLASIPHDKNESTIGIGAVIVLLIAIT